MSRMSVNVAPETEPGGRIARFMSALKQRPAVGRALLAAILLNEIRGIVVVTMVLTYWKSRHG
jgi:hypothetical protein